ncbi:NAD(+) diphosphatase [Arthrobacter sp.]|uniref:NAD(+) diphosphatase n=1 Tax=Arthrobacter sp. TaxID=1667 RepID=UPI003A8E9C35
MTFRQDHHAAPSSDYPLLGELPLARTGVDRGCERRMDDAWLPSLMHDDGTRLLLLSQGRAPVRDGALVLSGPADVPPGSQLVYLGRSAGHEIVLAVVQEAPELPGADWLGLRDVAAGLSALDAGLFVEAVAIANWHAHHTHCPRCGSPTDIVHSGWVRVCPRDASQHFPRTDPAIIVAITDDQDRLLLGANAQWGGRRYSTLAGFVEPGESLEEAVVREVGEEAGIRVASTRYAGSQPWPFPCSLMLGFTAQAESTAVVPDGEEIIDLRWFTREELGRDIVEGTIGVPSGVSISSALIEHWYGGPLPEPRHLEN